MTSKILPEELKCFQNNWPRGHISATDSDMLGHRKYHGVFDLGQLTPASCPPSYSRLLPAPHPTLGSHAWLRSRYSKSFIVLLSHSWRRHCLRLWSSFLLTLCSHKAARITDLNIRWLDKGTCCSVVIVTAFFAKWKKEHRLSANRWLSLNTGMCRIATFRLTTDRIYDGGPIILQYNIIILTTVLQLPTVFSTVTCCTGL